MRNTEPVRVEICRRATIAAPSLSILMPVWRTEEYVAESLAAVMYCAPKDAEIYLLDDASPDRSREIALRTAGDDPRVRIEAFSANCGAAAARRYMVEHTTAEYVALMDSDDLMLPGFLHRAVKWLASEPQTPLVYGRALVWIPQPDRSGCECRSGAVSFSPFSLAYGNPILNGAVLFRRSAVLAAGNFQPVPVAGNRDIGEDYYLWTRLLAEGPFRFIDEYAFIYRKHPGSLILGSDKQIFKEAYRFIRNRNAEQYADWLERLLSGQNIEVDGRTRPIVLYCLGLLLQRSDIAADVERQHRLLLAAQTLAPNDIKVLTELGLDALARHDVPGAAAYLEKVVKAAAKDPAGMGSGLALVQALQAEGADVSGFTQLGKRHVEEDNMVMTRMLEKYERMRQSESYRHAIGMVL